MNDSPWLANPAAPLTGYPSVVGDVGTERAPRTRMGLDMIADGVPFTLFALEASTLGNRNLTAAQGLAAVVAMCAEEVGHRGVHGTGDRPQPRSHRPRAQGMSTTRPRVVRCQASLTSLSGTTS